MFSIYLAVWLDPAQAAVRPRAEDGHRATQGPGYLIWLPSSGGKPSSDDLDDRAVTIFREIADMAAHSGLRVALYPHKGSYVERVEDAVRLAKKVDRKNVGVSFNLCHFLWVDDAQNLERRLKEAEPYCLPSASTGPTTYKAATGGRGRNADKIAVWGT